MKYSEARNQLHIIENSFDELAEAVENLGAKELCLIGVRIAHRTRRVIDSNDF